MSDQFNNPTNLWRIGIAVNKLICQQSSFTPDLDLTKLIYRNDLLVCKQ